MAKLNEILNAQDPFADKCPHRGKMSPTSWRIPMGKKNPSV